MENQKPKAVLYVKRSFGDKLNVSFDFIKENWKVLLKFVTYFLLPISMIQALSLNGLMGGALSLSSLASSGGDSAAWLGAAGIMFFVHYGLYILLAMVGWVLLGALIYGLIKLYQTREERLVGLTFKELKPLFLKNIKRQLIIVVISFLLTILASVLMIVLGVATAYTLILTIPAFVAFVMPLLLFSPIYLLEDISCGAALKKTYRLGFATWGGVVLMAVVMGFIANVLQGVTMMPWYISTLVKYFFTLSDTGSETTVSVGYSFMLYLLAILQAFGVYLSMIFTVVGMAYQYGHASEKIDAITVEEAIDNFKNL
ncbi:MAG: hypothetical protein EOM31_03455 [Bacteroidia bacterium]|nr:hypothetical protein [Bacteroidia bacterium]